MSEATHTPGPWVADETKAFGAYGVWTDYAVNPGHDGAGYGIQICSVITPDLPQTCKDDIREQRTANARLIAAAPDMLAALEALVADWSECERAECQVPDEINEDSHWEMARSAIAKAKGETP